MTLLAKAALAYAALGWRVHPCRLRDKRPMLPRWQGRAAAEPDQIAQWWHETPDANIGVACGPASGIIVLDIDGAEGEAALAALEARHGPLPELYPMQWTGSGRGWQAFFLCPDGRTIRNSAGRLGPKLDTRGDGGYVIVPPSVHPSGGIYRWADDREPWLIPPEPAPAWLIDLLDPSVATHEPRGEWQAPHRDAGQDRRALKALESELALVAVAPEGGRNSQLNRSAHALFRFESLSPSVVADGLLSAARHAGLPDHEARATVGSAARARGVSLGRV
jgi:hypothetical protein